MSNESTVVMGEYIIDLRVMCPGRDQLLTTKSLRMFSHKTRIVQLLAYQNEEQHSKCSMMLVFLMIVENDFGPEGYAPYKLISRPRSRKP